MPEIVLNWAILQNELKGFIYKRVKDKALAEDIVHDVFIKVQARMSQLQENEKIFGWIYQITRNTITDYFRSKSRSFNPKDIDWENSASNYNDCVSNCLNDLLQALPDKYRIPLEMTELQDLSQLAVAEKLGLSYSATKARVQRARKMLKDKMNETLIIKTDGYGNVIVCNSRKPCC